MRYQNEDEYLEEVARTCLKEGIPSWMAPINVNAKFLAIYDRLEAEAMRERAQTDDRAKYELAFQERLERTKELGRRAYGDHMDDEKPVFEEKPRMGFQRREDYYDRSTWQGSNRGSHGVQQASHHDWDDVWAEEFGAWGGFGGYGRGGYGGGGWGQKRMDFPTGHLDDAIAWLEKQGGSDTSNWRTKGSVDDTSARPKSKGKSRDPHGGRQSKPKRRNHVKETRQSVQQEDRMYRALYHEVFGWLTHDQKERAAKLRDTEDRDLYFMGIPDRVGDPVTVVVNGVFYLMRSNGCLEKLAVRC